MQALFKSEGIVT